MNKHGFTLIEVLTVIVIIAVLVSVALPMYTRAIERSRATEAMTAIKAMNDSIYAYYADKESCPTFKQLVAILPGINAEGNKIEGKHFDFTFAAPTNVPGTSCPGVKATRHSGGAGYAYAIWNPYASYGGKALGLKCAGTSDKDIALCESLGWYEAPAAQ